MPLKGDVWQENLSLILIEQFRLLRHFGFIILGVWEEIILREIAGLIAPEDLRWTDAVVRAAGAELQRLCNAAASA